MKPVRPAILIAFLFALSCNEPRTVVTNIVYKDGSIRRKIEMKSSENKFNVSDLQVPFDSTWTIKDSLEISEKGDTTWVKRAEKLFSGVDEINSLYKADSGANKDIKRNAWYSKKFRWFNTEYSYTETVDKIMKFGYPVKDFLDTDELRWFYSPQDIIDEKKNGPDSLKYRPYGDTVDKKIEKWMIKSLSSEWIHEFAALTSNKSGSIPLDSLMNREAELGRLVDKSGDDFDSLWTNGIILRELLGELAAVTFKVEADSAADVTLSRLFPDFKYYVVKTIMPGKLTSTNGFVDSTGAVMWPVDSDYFITGQYEMVSESLSINIWAWIVSGLFVAFVITGMAIRAKRKG